MKKRKIHKIYKTEKLERKMKKVYGVILFALVVFLIVGFVVNLNENDASIDSSNGASDSANVNSSSEQGTVSESSQISSEELAKHNSMTDCWAAYNGKVYDLTGWLPKHPGSAGAILPYCGTSSEFQNAFEKKHGKTKVALLMKVAILMGDFKVVGETG